MYNAIVHNELAVVLEQLNQLPAHNLISLTYTGREWVAVFTEKVGK